MTTHQPNFMDSLVAAIASHITSWARAICLYVDSPDESEIRATARLRRRMLKASLRELMISSGCDEAEVAGIVEVVSGRVMDLVDAAPPSPARIFWLEVLFSGRIGDGT